MKKIFNIGILSVAVSMLGACASINNLTGAKTLAQGKHEIFVGVDYSNLLKKRDSVTASDTTFGFDIAGRFGITNEDEVGVKLANTLAYIGLDYKRAIIAGGPFRFSTGAGLGYLKYSVGTADFKEIDLFVPAYVDYDLSDSFTLIAGPKLMESIVSGTGSTNITSLVISGGFRLGKETGLHVEAGYAIPFKSGVDGTYQLNAGIFY